MAFASTSNNLVSGDTNLIDDIFVRDLQTSSTTRVSVDSTGAQGSQTSGYPSISSNGRFVAFYSSSSTLVSGDTNGFEDAFVRDRVGDGYTLSTPLNSILSPATASNAPGQSRDFTATYSDANGASDINLAAFRVGGSASDSTDSLLCIYNATTDKLSIYNDSATALIGSVTPGTSTVLSNSQGSLNCAAVTVSKSDNTLTINWNVSATGAFAGTVQDTFLFVRDTANLSDGYDDFGNWGIIGNVAPSTVSVSPANVSDAPGVERIFTTTFSDPNGFKNFDYVTLRLGGSGTGSTTNNANAMVCVYNVQLNKIYLFDDAGNYDALNATFPGRAVVLSNSQGSINAANTSVSSSGTSITVYWAVKAKASFVGTRSIALICRDRGGLGNGYNTYGTWTITGTGSTPARAVGGLSTARASSDGITLVFDRTLDVSSAANSQNYTLRVNGAEVEARIEATTSKVRLHTDALHAGDRIEVAWHNVLDSKGHSLQGSTALTAQ